MRRGATQLLLSFAVIVVAAAPVAAQVTEVDTFEVGGSSFWPPDVAAGADGTFVFISTQTINSERRAVTRHFSAAAMPLGPGIPVDDTNDVRETAINARPDGTFVAAWHRRNDGSTMFGRGLDSSGAPVGDSFAVSDSENRRFPELRAVAGVSAGSLFLWEQDGLLARAYDATGTAFGAEFEIDQFANNGDATGLPDGGYVVLSDLGVRLYDGDGTPRGPATFTGYAISPRRIAVDPNGDMVVVGTGTSEGTNPGGVWMRRLDAAGVPGTPILVHPAFSADEIYVPDVELDAQGNALVVWAGIGTPTIRQIRGRAYDTANEPLGYEFLVADEATTEVRVARLANGHFVTTWNGPAGVVGKVLSLCVPSVAQCGDGNVHAACEECDDGLANSDTAPDACRTNCLLPRCSDGGVDSGEQCDDGNLANCDGCSALCVSEPGLVCGDGIPEPTCSQPCDDANATVGDGCTAQCMIEPIGGGGSRFTDCRSVWVVANPGNDPLTDKHGAFRTRQGCVDDDPACDFDGGTPGACTFHVRVCANASGMTDCSDGLRIAAWTLDKPSAKHAAANPTLAAVRASFTPVPGVVVGPSTADTCTDWLPVTVPLRGVVGNYRKAKVTVNSRATLYDDAGVDKDTLRLECLPAGS